MVLEKHVLFPSTGADSNNNNNNNAFNSPIAPAEIVLHSMDALSAPIQIHNHRFYHPLAHSTDSSNNNNNNAIELIKSSLITTLGLYPPVTGNVRVNTKGETVIGTQGKDLLGTLFLIDRKEVAFDGIDSEDLSPRSEHILSTGSPILAVKVTEFSCGTICVAGSLNHQVADLRGFLDFMETWALIARTTTTSTAAVTTSDEHKPDIGAQLPKEWTRHPGQFFPNLSNNPTPPAPAPLELLPEPATGPPAYLLQPSTVTNWIFSKSEMERMKKDFSPPPATGDKANWISTGDAIAALICGTITRARQVGDIQRLPGRSTLDSGLEKVAMAADGRERSPLGTMANGGYFGNFNTLWSTEISRSDLLSATKEAAGKVAWSIRKGLTIALSPKSIAERILFVENPENLTPPGRIAWNADIILTNWCRFDLKGPKLDFGWGKPFLATGGGGKVFPPAYSIMLQDHDSGDVQVLLTIEHGGADAVREDVLMNEYGKLQKE